MTELTHFSESGRARMVDVSEKTSTTRVAIASGVLRMQPATLARIRSGQIAKGNVLAVADVAETAIRRFDLLRVEMLFRLGQKRFDASIVNALRDLLHITTNDAQEMRLASNATGMLVIAQDDPDMLRELHRMLDELEWLASDLANEIDRRSPELSPLAQGALNGLLVQLHQMK